MTAMSSDMERKNDLSQYLELAENYHFLVRELVDADRNYLWSLAEEHQLRGDELRELVNDLLVLNDYPRMLVKSSDLCSLHQCAEFYSNLRTTVPNADHAYLWEMCTTTSEERLDKIVDIMLTNGDYPKIPGSSTEADHLELRNVQFLRVKAIIPDVDPDYLREKLEKMLSPEDLDIFLIECMENRTYRTIHEADLIRRRNNIRRMYTDHFDAVFFLDLIPDPESYFFNLNNGQNSQYKKDCVQYLAVRFNLTPEEASKRFEENDYCLAKSALSLPIETKKSSYDATDECLQFLQEMAFVENYDLIMEALNVKKMSKNLHYEEAKAFGYLLSCESCFNNEAPENIKSCSKGHIFCEDCIQRWAEMKINEKHSSVPCLEQCDGDFSLKVLQDILNQLLLNHLQHNIQESEVESAALDGLETCPFCSFAYIPREADLIFHCLNIECGEQSCRMCHKPNHTPLPCEPTTEEVKLRTFVEDRMTQAMVRICQNCGRRFIKDSGCNLIQCSCGTKSCYICSEIITGHGHFGKCPAHSTESDLHVLPVQRAAERAKEEAEERFPGVVLKYDPTKL